MRKKILKEVFMERKLSEKVREQKAITLIALVITIIILLIIAGVSIAMLTGENGILKKATTAKQNTLNAEDKENKILGNYEDTINEYVNGDRNDNENGPTGKIKKLMTAQWTNRTTSEASLATITPTMTEDMDSYFSYNSEDGMLTCKKSGWYLFNFKSSTYNSSDTGANVQDYIEVDGVSIRANSALAISISQEEMNTNSLNLYINSNSKTSIKNIVRNTLNSCVVDLDLYSL